MLFELLLPLLLLLLLLLLLSLPYLLGFVAVASGWQAVRAVNELVHF